MVTSPKAVIQRVVQDIFNGQQHELVDEFHDLKCCGSDPAIGNGQTMGTEQFKGLLLTYRQAFPDHTYEILDLLEDGDKVAMRWRVKGTHPGPLGELQPTGKAIEIEGFAICRIADGRIQQVWQQRDHMGLMEQLGQGENKVLIAPMVD